MFHYCCFELVLQALCHQLMEVIPIKQVSRDPYNMVIRHLYTMDMVIIRLIFPIMRLKMSRWMMNFIKKIYLDLIGPRVTGIFKCPSIKYTWYPLVGYKEETRLTEGNIFKNKKWWWGRIPAYTISFILIKSMDEISLATNCFSLHL